MKPIKILHYVEKSYDHQPSFIILMSDNKEYISNGCIFIEHTDYCIKHLILEYDCKKEMEELLSAQGIDNDKLVNGSYMFRGCKSITEPGDYPLLEFGSFMYCGCKNIKEPGDYPLLKDGSFMYYGCINVTKPGVYPLLEVGSHMYSSCTNLSAKGDYPLLEFNACMHFGCKNIKETK